MNVRLAGPEDDAAICGLLESNPMPGPMRLASACRPSFFAALRVEGENPLVVVAEDGHGIAGLGVVTRRAIFLNGVPAVARHLGSLRVAPRARGSAALAQGFRLLARELVAMPADITLTSILDSNPAAARVLTSRRAGLPGYDRWRGCVTRVISVRGGATPDRSVTVAGAGELAAFLAEHGPARNGFPVCMAADLSGAEDSRFPGLRAADFHVLRDDSGGISGMLGVWDMRRFRQTRICGYSPVLRLLRPWHNLFAGVMGRPLLPTPGGVVPLAFVTLPLIPSGDPASLRLLLNAARARALAGGLDYLVCAYPEEDSLADSFAGLPCREIRSTIFRVRFPESSGEVEPDNRPTHFEAGIL